MSRLYLVIFFSVFSYVFLFGQSELKNYLVFAKEKKLEGDLIHALAYYEKAIAIDSNTINILWEYAEALRAYKDYRKALYYYEKVFKREGGRLYPYSLINYGLMLKHNGSYEEALEVFKQGKKLYRGDRRGYLYLKTKQEMSACLWVKSALKDTAEINVQKLPAVINSSDAEFGHSLLDSTFYFSALKGDSVGQGQEVYDPNYYIQIYSSKISDEGVFFDGELEKSLSIPGYNVGNGCFSLDKKRFYFSRCKNVEGANKCKIMVARVSDEGFVDVDSLGAIINAEEATTTMPYVGSVDGDEVLFFSSDRVGGKGGLDIWYSVINNGNQYKEPKNLKRINSLDHELSPFWSKKENRLYFSSSWHEGFGGYDIFSSEYSNGMFGAPENIGLPINSKENDLYYFKTATGDSSFFSSNRIGVDYVDNPTCCTDVFLGIVPPKDTIQVVQPKETLAELNKRLPVTLYFHNDIPDPRSWDTTSRVNYLDSYKEYTKMLEMYKKEYAKGLNSEEALDAKDDIEDFFIEYVDQGVKDLFLFRDLLLEELEAGVQLKLIVKGFASPLAKSDYNVNLTKRRIASLVNYLKSYNDGVFIPYFEGNASSGGFVTVEEVPFGEDTSDKFVSDNLNDLKNSVYSRAAALERKIEIQSVQLVTE